LAIIENGQSQRGWSFSLDAPEHYAIYEQVLRASGRDADSPLRIIAQFAKERPPEENTAFVRREFGGLFRGYLFSQKQLAVGSLPEGLRIAWGDTVETPQAALIPWPDVAETLRGMLLRGEYMPQGVLDQAFGHEALEAADALWEMHRDSADDIVIFENEDMFKGGHPDSTARIAEQLKDPEAHASIVATIKAFAGVYEQNRNVMRFHQYSPQRILRQIEDVQAPHTSFEATPGFAYQPPPIFISQDEVDKVLRDDHIADQRFATFQYFTQEHTPKEQADYLKNRYGTGGRYDNVLGQWHDSKGIKLSHGNLSEPDTVLILTWPKAAKRVAQLIAADRFLSPADKEKYPQYLVEQERLAAQREQRAYIEMMAPLPSAEKRDTLSLRLVGYINSLPQYEKRILGEHGLDGFHVPEIEQIDALLRSPQQTQQLMDAFRNIWGAASGIFERNMARSLGDELREIYPMEYIFKPGDMVHIGGERYEVLSLDDTEARLTDPKMPLVPVVYSRDDFNRRLADSNQNDRFLRVDTNAPAKLLPDEAAPAAIPDVPMEYRYGMGSEVWLDDGDYVVFTASDSEVHLYNPRFPILMRNMPPVEFEQMLAENPANDYLLEPVEEAQEEPAPEAEPALSPEAPRILYKKYLPILLEEIRKGELYPYLRERDTDAYDAEVSVGSELDSLADSIREDDPAFFEAYDSLPQFREWLAYDIFDRTYQDMPLESRDSLARNEVKSDCPAWAQRPPLLEQVREELYLRGFAVSEELIADGIEDTGAQDGRGDFLAVADFIEREYLSEDEPEPDLEGADIPERTEHDAFNEYAVMFIRQVYDDEAYRNARANSDEQNAQTECYAAVDRIMQSIGVDDLELYKLYYDTPGFRERMQAYVFRRTYTDTQREIARVLRPARARKTAAQRNYEFLAQLAPEILSGEADYLRLTSGAGMMPLHIDRLNRISLSVSHYYEQGGDRMADPDMIFDFDREAGTLNARTFQQSGLGVFQEVEAEDGRINTALERQLNTFTSQWFRNIRNQGYRREVMIVRYADDALELVYGEDGQVRDISGEVSLIEAYTREHGIVIPSEKETAPAPQPGYEGWSEPATEDNAPEHPGEPSDDVNAYLPEAAPAPEQEDDFDPHSMLRQEIIYEGRRFCIC